MKRKFSPNKLYRLIRLFVILCTLIGLIYITLYYTIGMGNLNNASSFINTEDKLCNQYYPIEGDTIPGYKTNNADRAECYFTTLGQAYDERLIDSVILITISLPLVFFGGRLIYKYIFPKVEISKDKPS